MTGHPAHPDGLDAPLALAEQVYSARSVPESPDAEDARRAPPPYRQDIPDRALPNHSHHYTVWAALTAVTGLASAGFVLVLMDELRHRLRRAKAWWGLP